MKIELELLVTRRMSNNLVKQNCILERKFAGKLRIPDSILNNDLEVIVLKIFSETGVMVNSKDVEVCLSESKS